MIRHDRNFDDLTDRFARNIYGNAKGEIRLAVLWDHLSEHLPELDHARPLRVLDAGCGFGQLGQRLAEKGHQVVMNDLSINMLEQTRRRLDEEFPGHSIQFVHGPVQDLSLEEWGQFDLVLFHAVLEWLVAPRATLEYLCKFIKPGGHLSLMFYNRDALIYRNLIRGNWRKAESDELSGDAGGLTPYHPLSLDEVSGWLAEWGMPRLGVAGVRVIYDYMERRLRDNRPLEECVRVELKYARQVPYMYMGRYLHVIAARA